MTIGLAASIGPGLQKMLDAAKFPPWLVARFHDEGDKLQQASFAGTMWRGKGYGRVSSMGLPTDERALTVLLNPSDPFWSSSSARKADRDWGVKNAPKLSTSTHWTLGPFEGIAKIPVFGPIFKAAVSPITSVAHLAEGQPLSQAMVDNFKSQVGALKAVGPYAATIISFVPGIGTGVAAAISAGVALAQGKPIDEALEAAVKGAIPGGAIAAAGYDLAKKVASGENVGKAALETARAQLPAVAQKAFDIGVAVVSGKQLQQAIASAVVGLAPDGIKQVLDAGAKAIQATPGLSSLAKTLSSDAARQGLQLASGALTHTGINATQIQAMRSKLTGEILNGFDAALKSQVQHLPWLDSIVAAPPTPVTGPTAAEQLQQLAALTPEQRQQLQLAALTPDQQKQLVAYANAQKAPKPPEPSKPKAPAAKPPEPTRAPTAAATATVPVPAAAQAQAMTQSQAAASSPTAVSAGGPPYQPYPFPKVGTLGASGYPPYPPMGVGAPPPHARPPHPHGGHSPREDVHPHPAVTRGAFRHWGWGIPYDPDAGPGPGTDTCLVWGAPLVEIPHAMQNAALTALGASGGRPTTVRAPDGGLYLFTYEGDTLTARPCASSS